MKDLKNEYIKLTEDNVPNLWDRIEASIDELETGNNDNNKIATIKVKNIDNSKSVNIKRSHAKKRKKNNIIKFIPTIAAAAILLISVGIYSVMNNSNKNETSATTSYSDMAMAESAEAIMDESPVAEASKEAYEEEAAVAESDMADEAMDAEYAESTNAEFENGETAIKATANAIATNQYDITGIINSTDNERVVEVSVDEGTYLRFYVPDELILDVTEAINSNLSVTIFYEDISSLMKESLGDGYSDVYYMITKIEK